MATVPSIGRAVGQPGGLAAQPAEATRDLYERYGRQIFAYCITQLQNREDAEDAVQSTFLNAFRALERGVTPELESAWLYKIAQHVCLTRRRSWSRRRSVESPQDFDTVQELLGSPMRDTDDLSALTDALRTLPEQQRRAILLREWQGLTYKEIAAEMELSQAAVETLIFRARRSLAQALERLRGSGDMGSIFAAVKSLLFGAGTKVAVGLVTVATTSVVASTPQARHGLVHFVDAVSNVAAPAAPKPHHRQRAAAIKVDARAPAAPAATAKTERKAPTRPSVEQHATPAPEGMTKKLSLPAVAAAAPAAPTAVPVAHHATSSPTTAPTPRPAAVPPAATQPTETTPAQTTTSQTTTTTPTKTSTSGSSDGTRTATTSTAVAPSVGGFMPSSGSAGTYVQVVGKAFTGATAVKFNGTSAPFSVSSDGQLTTKVPDGATSGPITVVTPNGSATSGDSFTITVSATNGTTTSSGSSTVTTTAPAAPTFYGTSPSSGPVGTSIGIGGSHFTGATAVRFNGASADFTISSDTLIMTHVPTGATTGPITIVTPGGTVTSSSSFTVTTPATPTVEGISPLSGPVGATVQIGGRNFTGTTAVKFNGVSASFTVASDGQITAQVPGGATSGPVSVTTPNGTAGSTGSFTVTAPLPEISGFSPGSATAGSSVGIGGLHFTGATSVKFNGVAASFVVNSDTSITAVVPSGATSGAITVTTPNGTATSSGTFTVNH